MISAWRPTREELARLNQGAAIELCIVGTTHPPVSLNVGELPPGFGDFPAEAIGAAIREAIGREGVQVAPGVVQVEGEISPAEADKIRTAFRDAHIGPGLPRPVIIKGPGDDIPPGTA